VKGFAVVGEFDRVKRQLIGFVLGSSGVGQRCGELGMIERRPACPAFGIDQNELLRFARQIVAVPEVRLVGQPVGRNPVLVHALDGA
jgi:hypothetical protein